MGKGDCHSGNLLICSQNSSYRCCGKDCIDEMERFVTEH